MDALWILLGLAVPLGAFIGWCLGISGWRQAKALREDQRAMRGVLMALREEVAALRAALGGAGIAVPEPAPVPDAAPIPVPAWPPPPRPPVPEPAELPANPWQAPPQAAPAAAAPDPSPGQDPASAPAPRPGLEEMLTLRWGTWLGAGALVLAGVFLVRTAVEEGWLGPAIRCVLAGLLGAVLVVAAEWLRRKPLPERPSIPWPDQAPAALAAGGVAVLFGAAYGAAALYALVPPLIGFALLGLAAMAGIALALLQGPLVAAIGIAGAYVTPALVQTDDPSVPGLYAYLLAVTAAALVVLRQVGAAWLGWAATIAAAGWALLGGHLATGGDLWVAALFLPAVAALQLGLLPGAALEGEVGRRLAWIPFAILAAVALVLEVAAEAPLPPVVALLLLTPVAAWKGLAEPRLDRLPWVAALAGLLMLLLWPLGAWGPTGEAITIDGVVQAILPGLEGWQDAALRPFLLGALVLATLHAAAGAWGERRAAHPVRWAALTAAVPVLVLLAAYARVRGFALDVRWALAALVLAGGLVGAAALAMRGGARDRAGAHAAGAVAAMALAAAMLLSAHWLTLAVALFLPALAWVEARTELRALRFVALAVAALVLVRLLLNWHVLAADYGAWPVLNELLPAYGVPAACFALAAWIFRRRGDDAAVAVLEGGAVAFLTALILLLARHAVSGGTLAGTYDGDRFWGLREGGLQVMGLAVSATLLRLLNRRLGQRPVLAWGWRAQQGLALLLGAVLILANPAFDPDGAVAQVPVLNELLLAYALPGLLAAWAARAPESAEPEGFRQALATYALAALFAWVTLEVRRSFQPLAMPLEVAPPEGAELYAYSFAWLAFGAALLAAGVRSGARAVRLAALAVIALTVLKAFLVDMAALTGLWRVLSFLGLGLALIGLGWVYRRFVVTPGLAVSPPAPAPPG